MEIQPIVQQHYPAPQQTRAAVCLGLTLVLLGGLGTVLTAVSARRKLLTAVPIAATLSGMALTLCCHVLAGQQQPAAPPGQPDPTPHIQLTPLETRVQPLLEEVTQRLLMLLGLPADLVGPILASDADPSKIQPLTDRLAQLRLREKRSDALSPNEYDQLTNELFIAETMESLHKFRHRPLFERLNYLRIWIGNPMGLDGHRRLSGMTVGKGLEQVTSLLEGERAYYFRTLGELIRKITQELQLPRDAPWLGALPAEMPGLSSTPRHRVLVRKVQQAVLDIIGADISIADSLITDATQDVLRLIIEDYSEQELRDGIATILCRIPEWGRHDLDRLHLLRCALAHLLGMTHPDLTPHEILERCVPIAQQMTHPESSELERARGTLAAWLNLIVEQLDLERDALWICAQPQAR